MENNEVEKYEVDKVKYLGYQIYEIGKELETKEAKLKDLKEEVRILNEKMDSTKKQLREAKKK